MVVRSLLFGFVVLIGCSTSRQPSPVDDPIEQPDTSEQPDPNSPDPTPDPTPNPSPDPEEETPLPCANAVIDDGFACTIDACDALTGVVSHTGIDSACSVDEDCSVASGCVDADASHQEGRVIITELSPLGESDSIEVHNTTASAIDLTGYTLKTSSGLTVDAEATGSLSPSAYVQGLFAALPFASGGELIALYDASGRLQDRVDLRHLHTDALSPMAVTAIPARNDATTQLDALSLSAEGNDAPLAWCVTFYSAAARVRVENTLGEANAACTAVINEVTSGIAAPDAFIELAGSPGYLLGGATIDGVTLPSDTRMPLNGLFVLEHDASVFPLVLTSANATVLDTIESLPAALSSVSFGRDSLSTDSDAAADLHADNTPTPNAANEPVTFTVSSISPGYIPRYTADQQLTVAGTNFVEGMTASFGGAQPAVCTNVTPTSAVCPIPESAPARVDVTLALPAVYAAEAVVWEQPFYFAAYITAAGLQFPKTRVMDQGETVTFYGRVFAGYITDMVTIESSLIRAQFGYGPSGVSANDPSWTFFDADYNTKSANDFEYQFAFEAQTPGTFSTLFRFSTNGGATWTYGDADGYFTNEPGTDMPGTLTIEASVP